MNLNSHSRKVREIIELSVRRYGVQIKDIAIHNDHIHLLVWTKRRESLICALRLIAAETGRYYKRIMKLIGVRQPKKIWKYRPFTRLVSWGKRSLANVLAYFRKNRLEVLKLVDYTPRNHRLNLFLNRLADSS